MELAASEITFVANDWEEYARCYDSLMHLNPYRNMLYSVARKLQPNHQGVLLDASCGTGNFEYCLKVLPEVTFKHIIGIDASTEMLLRAKEKTIDDCSVTYLESNLNNRLPFSDDSITSVVSINTLYAVNDPRTTLLEFYRVLISGGKLLLVTPKKGCENGLILQDHCTSELPDVFWKGMHKSIENEELLIREAITDEEIIQDMLTVGRYNRSIVSNATFHFFQMDELFSLLTSIGFEIDSREYTYADQALFFVAIKP